MGITAPLRAGPFFTGSSSTATEVPWKFHVSVDGRPYMVDTVMAQEWRHETVPLLRQQSDDSAVPGEASLNPEGLWRRSWSSWHKGAGQNHRDREDSELFRFQESRGVNVWNRHELSLLNDVDKKRTSSNTNLKLVPCGSRLFLMDGADVVYTEDITADSPTWTACTNEPGTTLLDIASDGKYVWITDGSNSYWALGSASPPAFNLAGWTGTQDADVLGFIKGYLIGGHDNTLHYYSAAGAATAITISANLPDTFDFVAFAGGPTNAVIYAAGFSGDKSLIFRVGIREDGTGLDAAIVAAELPDGEIVRSISTYLGFVLIGTDNGVRFATPDSSGNLTIGALLETGAAVRCFEGQGPYVWFGWEDFQETVGDSPNDYHGLGRLSLEEFSSTDAIAPAYATDLMVADANGSVTSVVTFQDRRVWCIGGTDLGVWGETATPATSGYLLTGLTDYGFVGDKSATQVDVAYNLPASATISVDVEVNENGNYQDAGSISATGEGTTELSVGGLTGSRFNVLLSMTASATSPTVSSFTLLSTPAVPSTVFIQVPLLFSEWLDPDGGVDFFDVEEERNAVIGWWQTKQPITYVEPGRSHTVAVWDWTWMPRLAADDMGGFRVQGTMLLKLKEL